jgi:tight adherence protein C
MQLLLSVPLLLLMGVVFCGVLGVMLLLDRPGRTSRSGERLQHYMNTSSPSEVNINSAASGRPAQTSGLERILGYAAATAPQKLRATTATDLAKARINMSPSVFLGLRGVLLIGAPLLGLIWILSLPQKGPLQWAMLGMLVLGAPRLPSIWLQRRVKTNTRAIERALPYALDLMVACLEGGLSLEATLDKVASENDSLLSDELRRTMAEIALGRPSADALRDLGTRTGVADLKRLTESVLQAERMGISIAEAMRTLADESRIRRRQRAEEEAQKAPIKMVPVMVMTTLPAIGAVVLTPSVISLSRALSVFTHR